MLGHGLLAFALVASLAASRGYAPRRALAVGVVAGAFGILPDVDMLYAVWGAVGADAGGLLAVNEAFWAASRVAHRSATHSLVVAVPTALAAGLVVRRRDSAHLALASALLAGVVAAGGLASGTLDALILSAFVLAAAGVALAVRRWTDLAWWPTTLAAATGLLAHPWGDLFTGGPPHLLYPLDLHFFDGRVVVAADPTIHLLFTFALEVVAVWAAATVYLRLADRPFRPLVDRQAALGAGYAAAVAFVPAPTLDVPSAFVFSILGVGVALAGSTLVGRAWLHRPLPDGGSPDRLGRIGRVPPAFLRAGLTGTAGVTLAWVAYLATYVLV